MSARSSTPPSRSVLGSTSSRRTSERRAPPGSSSGSAAARTPRSRVASAGWPSRSSSPRATPHGSSRCGCPTTCSTTRPMRRSPSSSSSRRSRSSSTSRARSTGSARSTSTRTGVTLSDFGKGNVKARMRMVAQYAMAGEHGLLVIGTDHAAEAVTGFFTKYGDGGADVLPLTGLTKRQGRALLQHLGAPERMLPEGADRRPARREPRTGRRGEPRPEVPRHRRLPRG